MNDDIDERARAILESAGIVAPTSDEAEAMAAVERTRALMEREDWKDWSQAFGYDVRAIEARVVMAASRLYGPVLDIIEAMDDGERKEALASQVAHLTRDSIALSVLSTLDLMGFRVTRKGG